MPRLGRCPRCARHVRVSEMACPFCALGRAALAASIGAALFACKGDAASAPDAAPVRDTPIDDRPKPVYGGPPGARGAGSVDDWNAQQLLNSALSDGSAPPVAPPPSALASAVQRPNEGLSLADIASGDAGADAATKKR